MTSHPTWPPYPRLDRFRQPRIKWPNDAHVAFWVAPNIEYYEFKPAANGARPPWPRPEPDILHASRRDYGNRVGVWRCLDVFDRHGIVSSVSLNSAMCIHLPEVVRAFVDRGWELFCHGTYNTRYLFGLSPEQELDLIRTSCEQIEEFSGQKVRGFLSPALTYTESTFSSLAEAGLLYTLDLFHEDVPAPLSRAYGRMISIPYQVELNDFHAVVQAGMAPQNFVSRFKAQFDQLYEEGEAGGKVVSLPLHPYVIGTPEYIWALEEIIAHVRKRERVWLTSAGSIATYYMQHYFDDALSHSCTES